MSFWNKVKNVAKNTKCKLGFHEGEFTQIEGKPKCHLEKVCTTCLAYLTEYNHDYTEWELIKEKECLYSRTCKDCQLKEKENKHEWIEKKREDCLVIQVCKRCNSTGRELGFRHKWIEHKHTVMHADGRYSVICTDCNKVETRFSEARKLGYKK